MCVDPAVNCKCDDGTWCKCWPDDSICAGLREPHGDVPDDGAIEEIVKAMEAGETEVGA